MVIVMIFFFFYMKFKYSGFFKKCVILKLNSKGIKDILFYFRIVFYMGCFNFLFLFDIFYCWLILIFKILISFCEGY